jgi:hypothetical protein
MVRSGKLVRAGIAGHPGQAAPVGHLMCKGCI